MNECSKLEVVQSLIDQLEAEEIPDDYDRGNLSYNEILADIRHTYTNYEELLYELPECVGCTWNVGEEGIECPNATLAHDQLKWAARSLAESIYMEWLKKRKK